VRTSEYTGARNTLSINLNRKGNPAGMSHNPATESTPVQGMSEKEEVLFPDQTVILVTYEYPRYSPMVSTMLTVVDQKGGLFPPWRAGVHKGGLCPNPAYSQGVERPKVLTRSLTTLKGGNGGRAVKRRLRTLRGPNRQ